MARLIKAFPGIVAGMKDSSGDADHTRRTIEAFPGFAVFPGANHGLFIADPDPAISRRDQLAPAYLPTLRAFLADRRSR